MVKKSLLWIYRVTLFALWFSIFVLASSVLALRYVILPHIDDYKDKIAQQVSLAAGQKVTIGEIKASWHGLNPHLSLFNVDLYDAEQRPALSLEHIEASMSWLTIPLLEPRLSAIEVYNPELTIRRETDGTLYVAGIHMGGPSRPAFPNWLLKQSRIDVIDASVLWQDDFRKAPPLTLNKLNLQIINPAWETLIGHHRFGLRATPSAGSSFPIDIRGNVYGKDVSKLQNWRGTLFARVEGTDIAAWRNWISYPFDLREGFGAAQFWMDFAEGKPTNIISDVILSDVKTRLAKNSPEATLNNLSGRLEWTEHSDGQEIRASKIKMSSPDGLNMQNGKINLRERLVADKNGVKQQTIEGNIHLDEIRLESVNTFANYLPIPKKTLQQLTDISPVGKLKNLELEWKGDESVPQEYSIRSQFIGLGIKAYEHFPGFSNLSGSIDADEDSGTLTINSQRAFLDFEKVMRWPIPADKLTGQVKWINSKHKTEIRASNIAIANPHLSGTINANYIMNGIKGGFLELNAKFANADGKFAHYYYPKILGEHTLHWLDTAILAGHGEDINVTIKGNLAEFPYPNNKLGLFRVTAKITDGMLDYAPGWPKIDGVKLNMLFEGTRMELNANAGYLLGNQITKAKVSIPVLHAEQPVLDIAGEVQGPISEGLKYINTSPLVNVMRGFTSDLKTTGNGKLNLELHIPLHNTEATIVKGAYVVNNASMAADGVPELTKLTGKLEFTESSLKAQNITTSVYGGPAQFSLYTGKDHVMRINARGRITDVGLKQAFGAGLMDRITGSTDWAGNINIFDKQLDMSFTSNLVGLASSLPAPLSKGSLDIMPLRFDKKQTSPSQDNIIVSIGNVLGAKLLRTNQQGTLKLERGEIGINVVPELPAQPGINVRGNLDYLDLDEWQNIFDKASNIAGGNTNGNNKNNLNIGKIDMTVNTLDVFDRRINALKLNAKPSGDGWTFNLQSREITGDAQWSSQSASQGNGKLSAKLKSLIIPSAAPNTAELRTQGNFKQQAQSYPALDITAENFEFGKKKLGRLELQASEQNDDWSIEKLRIINPDSTLTAEGDWHNWKRNPNTRMTISWDINDLGKTLDRFGFPNTIKGGDADLTGQLKWPGSPHEFDIPGLSGNLQLDARHGQILKIQPGVGRLFSVLSLQNLPRRLTFDFRDVFSSGFTFDKVSSSVKIDRGVMRSDDFKMEGPTARVEMKGETDLQKETQHLYIKVTPYISDTLSIAALAGGPVVGAAAFVAQKLLRDPINKLAADEYEITGTWDNPQEIKDGTSKPPVPSVSPLGK
ncbi:MAG TPA: YhdP family protein [Methylophilaceae bacterium]|nr:YhdP family protein [Methylophilaceae bacterium]